MNDKIKGIVLRIIDYKDNDQILHVLSEKDGVLSLVCKSSKKILSKRRYFEGCLYEFIVDLKDNKNIYSIHNSKLIKSYYDLDNTLLYSFKLILLEAIYKSKELYEEKMFTNLIFILDRIDINNKYLLGSLYFSYLLNIHGIKPNVEECVICKNKKVVAISNKLGGFLCVDHLNGEKPSQVDALKKFRLIVLASINNYDFIKDFDFDYLDFKRLVDFFIHNSAINLVSFDFYTRINNE